MPCCVLCTNTIDCSMFEYILDDSKTAQCFLYTLPLSLVPGFQYNYFMSKNSSIDSYIGFAYSYIGF